MSQHSFVVANALNTAYRSDLTAALQALASQSLGASAPATTYADQPWYDSTKDVVKRRNDANSAWVNVRTSVPSGTILYVRADGSDNNGGMGNSAGGAFLTIQAAVAHASNLIDSPSDLVVKVQDGIWNLLGDLVLRSSAHIAGRLILRGNTTSPRSCALIGNSAAAYMIANNATGIRGRQCGCGIRIEGFRLSTTNAAVNGIASYNVPVEVQQIDFGDFAGAFHMSCVDNGMITAIGSMAISGSSASTHGLVYRGGAMILDGATYVMSGSPAFTWVCFYAVDAAALSLAGQITVGSTGGGAGRWQVSGAAAIDTGGVGTQGVFGPGASGAGLTMSNGIIV